MGDTEDTASAPDGLLVIEGILGHRDEEPWHERLHDVAHHGVIEVLAIAPADTARHRLRGITDAGTDCAVVIARNEMLFDGAVLYLDDHRAIVLKVGEQQWMRLRPADAEAALELGYHAGNLHWRVRFDGSDLEVAIDGRAETYLERIAGMVDARRVVRVG